MRKSIVKLMCLLLLLVFVFTQFSFTLNVKAISVKGENSEGIRTDLITDNVTITVTGVDSADTFATYKILDSFYNSETNEVTHEFTGDFNTFLNTDSIKKLYPDFTVDKYMELTSDYIDENGAGQASSSVITTSTLNVLISKYATYISANNIEGTSMTTSGSNATATVQAGSYLVLPTQTVNVYSVMIGNATYEAENGEWVLNNPTIVSKRSISRHEFGSFITNSSGDWAEGMYTEKAYEINQTYTNIFGANIIQYPTNAINTTNKFEINLDNGITFGGLSTIQVSDQIGSDFFYSITEDGSIYNGDILIGNVIITDQKITFEFDTTKVDTQIVVYYKTSLNENANLGLTGNETVTKFTYASDPYSTSEDSYTTVESVNIAYTYGLIIKNYGDKAKTKLLEGSVFEIYSDSDLNNLVGKVTISNGEATLFGVSDGTYYLKQTKVPTGYKLKNTTAFTVDNASDYYTVEIINEEAGFLPSTGGIGTIIYTIVGLLIITTASFGVIYYRKKSLNS